LVVVQAVALLVAAAVAVTVAAVACSGKYTMIFVLKCHF
jgi:hypothetical protein